MNTTSHPTLRYTLYRFGILLAVVAVVWPSIYFSGLTGAGAGILIVGISLAVSGMISFRVLNRQRDEASAALYRRVEDAKMRIGRDGEYEDQAVDAMQGQSGRPAGVEHQTAPEAL